VKRKMFCSYRNKISVLSVRSQVTVRIWAILNLTYNMIKKTINFPASPFTIAVNDQGPWFTQNSKEHILTVFLPQVLINWDSEGRKITCEAISRISKIHLLQWNNIIFHTIHKTVDTLHLSQLGIFQNNKEVETAFL